MTSFFCKEAFIRPPRTSQCFFSSSKHLDIVFKIRWSFSEVVQSRTSLLFKTGEGSKTTEFSLSRQKLSYKFFILFPLFFVAHLIEISENQMSVGKSSGEET